MLSSAPDTPLADRNPNDFYIPDVKISTGFEPKQLSLEEKLLLYAQECWNDSTVEYTHHYLGVSPDGKNGIGYQRVQIGYDNTYYCNPQYEPCSREKYPSHYTRKVIHRKPTFEHFLEWLKKK